MGTRHPEERIYHKEDMLPLHLQGDKRNVGNPEEGWPSPPEERWPSPPILTRVKEAMVYKEDGGDTLPHLLFFSDNKEGGHCPPRVDHLLNLDMCMSPPPLAQEPRVPISFRRGKAFPSPITTAKYTIVEFCEGDFYQNKGTIIDTSTQREEHKVFAFRHCACEGTRSPCPSRRCRPPPRLQVSKRIWSTNKTDFAFALSFCTNECVRASTEREDPRPEEGGRSPSVLHARNIPLSITRRHDILACKDI